MQRIVLVPIVIGMILGCASKFGLESNSFINTTESYYSEWNSPIRDGGSGYSIYIFLDEKLKEPTKLFEIQGIYFKDTYVNLKHQNTSLYQDLLKIKSVVDP